jgi:DNA-binding PadR family transcriptional regulator
MSPADTPVPALGMGAVAVLHAVASGHAFGFDIIDATGLTSGTVYPTLDRLEELGLLRSHWEDEEAARREGRPARRNFAVTAAGARALAASLKRYKVFRPVRVSVES